MARSTVNKPEQSLPTLDTSDLHISRVKTSEVLRSLQTTFDIVSSGQDYNKEQVKNMTNISNSMVKLLRFEFDVYKFFSSKIITRPDE